MKENTYAIVTRKVNRIKNNNQPENYRALVEKLNQIEPNHIYQPLHSSRI